MAQESTQDAIKRYLQDAIAAENSFESQLREMAQEGDQPQVQQLFSQHADETHSQIQRLTARLEALGGSTSTVKSFMAHMFGMAPKTAQIGHDSSERATQNVMMAFAVENSEVAMYESLITCAEAAGDTQTAALAREIQQEERVTAQKLITILPQSARMSFQKVTSGAGVQS